MPIRFHTHWFRDVVVILCSYEVVAITTRRVPTLTQLQHRYKVVGPAILVGLALHFYTEDLKWLSILRERQLDDES